MEMQVSIAKMKVMNKQDIVMMKMSNLMRTKVVIIQTRVNMIQMMRLTLNPSDQC